MADNCPFDVVVYIWQLRDKKQDYDIKWTIIRQKTYAHDWNQNFTAQRSREKEVHTIRFIFLAHVRN